MNVSVPNCFPRKPAVRRLAIIGEAPGADEAAWHVCIKCGHGYSSIKSYTGIKCPDCGGTATHQPTPFVGPSGRLLNVLLSGVGIDRDTCFVGNVCQVQPPANKIELFKWDGPELTEGLAQLRTDLAAYQPHMLLLLGNTPLKALTGDRKRNVGDWRGSLLMLDGVKALPTYHPAALLREANLTAVCRLDMRRLAEELPKDGLTLPVRNIEVSLSFDQLLERLANARAARSLLSVDIEGVVGHVECIGFATSPTEAFVVPFIRVDGTSVWSEAEEYELWAAVGDVLSDPTVPKVLQNSLYDCFVLAWTYGIVIRGVQDDTMLKHHELYCELEKSLGFQASIYTREPFYKFQRKSVDDATFLTYCGKDCCTTYECNHVMDMKLMPGQRKHYEFNMRLLTPLLYMELRGIRYDHEKAKAKLKRVQRWIYVLQDMLNRAGAAQREDLRQLYAMGGKGTVDCEGAGALVPLIRSKLCLAKPRRRAEVTTTKTFKNGKTKTSTKTVSTPADITTLKDCQEFALPSQRRTVKLVAGLVKRGRFTPTARGRLSVLLDTYVKVNSTGSEGDACKFLYETCGFPKQFQKEGNKLTTKLASDDEALIKIWVAEEKKPTPYNLEQSVGEAVQGTGQARPLRLKHRGRLALVFLKLRRLITQTKTLRVAPDADGRMRCAYNAVGTETARLTCYESPTGSGYNLQTTTKKQRDLFMADEGCLMAQCDLAGADGWTVAAYAAAQGDRTMLDDYKAGIKPAKVGVLMWQQGPAVNKLDRKALKDACKAVDGDSWQYFGFKRVQHGSSYKMGKITMSDQILTDSWKLTGRPVLIPPATCEQMQRTCFFARYWGIPRWHAWMEQEIKRTGCIIATNGFKRLFFGRKDDYDTVKAALAHLPQVYTTYATMLALSRLWSDPENRQPDGSLKVEPLHTVHDSLLDQFAEAIKEWAAAKHREWFNNPLLIAQETLVIPFEGAMGRDWRNLDQGAI
jgi:uracil-DNA glycosylase family 4